MKTIPIGFMLFFSSAFATAAQNFDWCKFELGHRVSREDFAAVLQQGLLTGQVYPSELRFSVSPDAVEGQDYIVKDDGTIIPINMEKFKALPPEPQGIEQVDPNSPGHASLPNLRFSISPDAVEGQDYIVKDDGTIIPKNLKKFKVLAPGYQSVEYHLPPDATKGVDYQVIGQDPVIIRNDEGNEFPSSEKPK